MTARDALGAALADSGVVGVVGEPLGALDHWPCEDPDIARLLAGAIGRLGPGLGASLVGSRLHLSDWPGFETQRRQIDGLDGLEALVSALLAEPMGATWDLDLALDLDAAADRQLGGPAGGRRRPPSALSPDLAGSGLVLVAGSAVVRSGFQETLRAVVDHTGIPCALTVGSVGMLGSHHPRSLGVVGLEPSADAAVNQAPLVVVCGVPEYEFAPPEGPLVLEVDPAELGALGTRWPAAEAIAPAEVSAEVVARRSATATPVDPVRCIAELGDRRPDGALLAVSGEAARWLVALDAAESALDVVVADDLCSAVALAAASERAGRPAMAVGDGPPDDRTRALLAWTVDHGPAGLRVVTWDPAGELSSADDLGAGLDALWAAAGVRTIAVPVETDAPALSRVTGPSGRAGSGRADV